MCNMTAGVAVTGGGNLTKKTKNWQTAIVYAVVPWYHLSYCDSVLAGTWSIGIDSDRSRRRKLVCRGNSPQSHTSKVAGGWEFEPLGHRDGQCPETVALSLSCHSMEGCSGPEC